MARKKHPVLSPADWKDLPDEELLQLRVRDLGLKIEASPLEPCVQRLYAELDAAGIRFHPPCYLTNEWLCPDKVPMIGIPFYLAHPRLIKLEKKKMLEVEGGTDSSCMKILRHEAGHALNYAYLLFQRTRWRELFGPFSAKYSDFYHPKPYSKRYVVHLEHSYAQSHPDEDFAETFAVWLTPNSRWRERYRGWPALKKLRYVEHLMRQIGSAPPRAAVRQTPWSSARMTSTLTAFYQRKREHLGEEFPGFYDPALQRLFCARAGADSSRKASDLLRQWRRHIVDSVATWTGELKYDIDRLVGKLIRRCDALELYVSSGEVEAVSQVTGFVTAVMNRVTRFAEDQENR